MEELTQVQFMKWKNRQFMINIKVSRKNKLKVSAFVNATKKYFKFLEDYNYTLKSITTSKQHSVKDIIEIRFENEEIDRLILIIYEPDDIKGNVIDLLGISFYNGIKSLNKELVFEKFLEKYKPELEIEHLIYPNKNNKDSFDENVELSLSGLSYFIKEVGISLVDGTDWEDGLFYDWSSAQETLYKEQKKQLGDNESEES